MDTADDSSLSHPTENNHQSFFVLHRASSPRKATSKARRKIDLSTEISDASAEECDNKRSETFKLLWSDTESIIKEVLKNINANVYDEIQKWVQTSFDAICSHQKLDFTSATCPYPILNDSLVAEGGAYRKIFTGLLYTKNMEFVDDILTFSDLGVHLRSHGCNVANLSSSDFSAKKGVGGCIKTLLRQFLAVGIDGSDMSVLASWNFEQKNSASPMVVIVDDVERCCGSVLADFIIMLREWVVKIPIILILGVATTVDVLKNLLSSNVCSHLSICEFTLGTPCERMNAVVEAVLLKNSESFSTGKHVSTFLRNYFVRHDGTLTLFIRALRIAMAQHVYARPSTVILRKYVHGEEAEGIGERLSHEDNMLKQLLDLPSLRRFCKLNTNSVDLPHCLSELKRLNKLRSSAVMCLHEVGKYRKNTLLDVYCQMLQSGPNNSIEPVCKPNAKESAASSRDPHLLGHLKSKSCVVWTLQILRDLPLSDLSKLLDRWVHLTRDTKQVQEKIKELQSSTTLEGNRLKADSAEATKRPAGMHRINQRRAETTANEKVVAFLEHMAREYIQPTQSIPFNEVVFFDDVDRLQTALIGDPRRRIQADLLDSSKFLRCSCCNKNTEVPLPTMHRTAILYSLAQEHGDLINLHEWFHSFKEILRQASPAPNKKRSRASPSPKKQKSSKEPQERSNASIQSEFCRAVMELQITGLVQMPTKKRPDFVQRTAFGL